MKIVIDIPDEVYNFTIQRGHLPYGVNIAGSIIDGIPYEATQGDLISREALKEEVEKYLEKRQDIIVWESDIYNIIDNAPAIEPTFGLFKDMLCSECDKRQKGGAE